MNEIIPIQIVASICFFLAVMHTFSVKFFQEMANKYPEGSVKENLFHLLGEVEVVFGLWAGIFTLLIAIFDGGGASIEYLNKRNFTEPLLVFVLMAVCSTKPILKSAEYLILLFSKILPLKSKALSYFLSVMIIGPILGSFITEPAAMTVTSLILLEKFYNQDVSNKFKYAVIGLLFVSVSIGGTLTPYAAPPVLMVAGAWGWDLVFMLKNFGWKAVVSIVISTSIIGYRFRAELSQLSWNENKKSELKIPLWVYLTHLIFLGLIVLTHHHSVVFMGLFLFFMGVVVVSKEYQNDLNLKTPLLVAFFLGGLVVLGGMQSWWLQPLISRMESSVLYLGAITLTAFTDNAAITYLGAQIPNLLEPAKYALVAGSVVGGGLTVIANAPNPAGYSTLNPAFGSSGISAYLLFRSALIPTLIAGLCFWVL